ncbi:MAG: 3-methyl-2-oxobutanoate dehydrogenase subunit VorB [bacterium]|jgi:2-oxoglutarate ferredoxin oxidoreductase subunit alpha
MGERVLMKGNEALGEAAIRAGCRLYFAYPITPQSELPQYLARRLPEVGGVYLQAESEIAAINMVYGAAGAGAKVMTSSSSPGISLKQEGISYLAGAELPCVIVNIVRGGPGLGGIQPAQSDYFQATKGGGHGDYRLLVLAPASVQEMVDLTILAFTLADQYRNPVMILGDGILGQMMEPVEFKQVEVKSIPKPWATTGRKGRQKNLISSIHLEAEKLEKHNLHLQAKYKRITEAEIRYDAYQMEDAQLVVVAYGISARIARSAVDIARTNGIPAGLIRPITLFPFPYKAIANAAAGVKAVLTVEMSAGQMVEDVRLALAGSRIPVEFYGRMGGMVPTPDEVYQRLRVLAGEEVAK